MIDIIHRIGIKAPASKVYAAVATPQGVAGWWSRETTGDAKVGGMLDIHFRNPGGEAIGRFELAIVELVPDQRVRWRVKGGPDEWVGTEIVSRSSRSATPPSCASATGAGARRSTSPRTAA
jgi:uncharacterized protein YndB with AHSA1/START domain